MTVHRKRWLDCAHSNPWRATRWDRSALWHRRHQKVDRCWRESDPSYWTGGLQPPSPRGLGSPRWDPNCGPKGRAGFSRGTVEDRVHPCCPFSHRTRPPEMELPQLQVYPRPSLDALFCLAAVAQTGTQVAEIALPLDRAPGYSQPTLASIIVPVVMTSHLKPVSQSPAGITTNKKRTTIPGQTRRHQFPLGRQTTGLMIRPLVPQRLQGTSVGPPYNRQERVLASPSMSWSYARRMCRCVRFTPSCRCSSIPCVAPEPPCYCGPRLDVPQKTFLLYQRRFSSVRPPPDKSLSVRNDNRRTAELHLAPEAVVDRLPSIDPETSPSLKTTMHAESDALPQDAKVAQSRLDSSPMLQRDSHLQKEVIRTLLRFADVISIGDYGKTNLISPASTVNPGTTSIRMKQRPLNPLNPLNPVKKESLWQQVDQRVE